MTGQDQGQTELQKKIDSLQETLKQVNYQNTMMLRWVNGAVVAVDREGRVTQANKEALTALGWSAEEFIGRHKHQTIHHSQSDGSEYPWDFCPVFAAIEDGSSHHVDGDVFWKKDGSSFSADFIVCPLRGEDNEITGAVLTFRNLTEQRLQEANRIHSMKLESIGELAAGIAHEINTPIQFVGTNLSFLRESFSGLEELIDAFGELRRAVGDLPQFAELAGRIDEISAKIDLEYLREETPPAFEQTMNGVERVSKLVLGLKGFAHAGAGEEKNPSDINQIIANTLVVCRNAYKYVAELETHYADLPLVPVFAGDLGQVIVNLVVNAAQAIADVKKDSPTMGKITITTSLVDKVVTIAIADSGGGIPEGIRQRIFDPFFTTKDVGRGSGQGLAISRTIIHDKHHGEITFTSQLGVGTIFYVTLPV